MARFAFFVDGSNLFGSLTELNLSVPDYEHFYLWLFNLVRTELARTRTEDNREADTLLRVYWYVVGSMDAWDLTDPKAQATLRDVFTRNKEVSSPFLEEAGRSLAREGPNKPSREDVDREAWAKAFSKMEQWFTARVKTLDGMRRFHHAVRSSTDFIDIVEAGHWKVDFLKFSLEEKGLDAALAVDMVALLDTYDVAVVVSGDADMLPSIRHAKSKGKHVVIVEFVGGYPPEHRGRGMSSRLRLEADLVARAYEMELIQKGLAEHKGKSEG